MPPDDSRSPAGRGPHVRLQVSVCDADGVPLRRPALASWLAAIAPARARGRVAIAFVSDARMRRLNRVWRHIDRATDVLSFPATERFERRANVERRHLGDIVIATGVAARQAREAGHPEATEWRVLALHGLLHLLGYDHERDGGEMARVEARLRRRGGLDAGLMERGRGAGPAKGRALRTSGPKGRALRTAGHRT